MAVNLSSLAGAGQQFFTDTGVPLSGGKLYSYAAGTTTPQATYTTAAGSIAHANPIILDSAGRVSTGEIWLTAGSNYKFVLKTSADITIATWDNITGINGTGITSNAVNVQYDPPFTNGVSTNVQVKLSQYITAEDFGAVGNGTANDTTALQNAIDSLTSGQILLIQGNYKITSALTITNKSRIRLTGKGRIFLSGASSSSYLLRLIGTIDNLEIDGLTLVGDNNAGYTQCAIGCNSGQTVSNTSFHDLIILNINVGISHNADLGGSWTNGLCYNNYLENMVGTVAGSGYGIQASRAYNLKIYGNTVNNASRHAIYIGQGYNLACLIENNIIINHRKDVYDGSPRCGIDVSRVSGVSIIGNTFRDNYDGQIYIGTDNANNRECADILVLGNKFGSAKNAVPCIWVGEQLVPTTNVIYKIDILDNTFEQDCAVNASTVILIMQGQQITIKNNRLRAYSVNATLPTFCELGDTRYITSDTHIGDITVSDNVASSDKGSTVSGSKFLYIVDQLCTGSSRYTAKNNSWPDWETEYYFEASPPTNPNSKLKFTTTITYTWNIPASTVGSGAFDVNGTKTTSSVTVRPDSNAMVAPFMAISGYARTQTQNAIELYAVNTNATTASVQTDMVHNICIEDF
jgi:hypothetical protein